MEWVYNPYSLPLLVAALISAGQAIYAFRRRLFPGAGAFALLMMAVGAWSFGYSLELVSSNLGNKLFWARLQYLGIVTVPLAWLMFTLQFSGWRNWITRPRLALLAVPPALTLLLVWTNETHHLIWSETELGQNGLITVLEISHGPAFWLHTLYSYTLIFAGTLLLLRHYFQAHGLLRQQARVVLLAAMLPWVANAAYLFRINPFLGLDLTPFAFALTGLLFAWGFLRLQFLDLIPAARGAVVESMRDAVFVLDAGNRLADLNPAGVALLGRRRASRLVGQPAEQVFAGYPGLLRHFKSVIDVHEVLEGGDPDEPQYYDLQIVPLSGRLGHFSGWLIILQDITEKELARVALQISNLELERRVEQRTSDLEAANTRLQNEVLHKQALLQKLQEREAMEHLVAGISTNFINRTIDEIDFEINHALQTVGEYAGVDRCYVFRRSVDGATLDNTHEWSATGIVPQKENLQGIPCAALPWWMGKLSRGETIFFKQYGTMPLDARKEKEILRSDDLQSLLVVPLTYQNSLVGFLGFDSVHQEKIWAEVDCTLLRLVGEIFANAFARKSAEEALQTSEAELQGVFAAMNDHVVIFDENGKYLKVASTNPASQSQPAEDLVDRTVYEVLPDETADSLVDQIQKALFFKKTVHIDYSLVINDQQVWFSGELSPIKKNRVVMVSRDITDRKASEDQLVFKALHDSLTGLPNRRLFLDRLERAFERVKRHPDKLAAVLFLDLDRFKVINDSLGHTSGDKFLVVVARRLRTCMRSNDTVSRLGGDEFAILLEDIADIREAVQVAERVQIELSTPCELEGHQIFSSASIGIAMVSTSYNQPEEILRDADAAMYRAKTKGKGRHEAFDAEMHLQNLDLLQLQADLRQAIELGEFRLFYQPIVDLKTGCMIGVEALLRWEHPRRGMLFPDSFLPLAEETRLIWPIGEWVLRTACAQVKAWQVAGHPRLRVAVNISAHQFRERQLLELVPAVLEETSLDPGSLEIEVTEETAMQDVDLTVKILTELSRLGVHISIDDFGKGYSSLSYLKCFPTNTLKIDRSFILDVVDNQNGSLIASAIIAMAHKLRLNVVAEGVETRQQLSFLASQKCDQIQGYLISRAVPPIDLQEMLVTSPSLYSTWGQFDRQMALPGLA